MNPEKSRLVPDKSLRMIAVQVSDSENKREMAKICIKFLLVTMIRGIIALLQTYLSFSFLFFFFDKLKLHKDHSSKPAKFVSIALPLIYGFSQRLFRSNVSATYNRFTIKYFLPAVNISS